MFKELRNFGLDRYDFPTLVGNVSALLWMLTINIDSRRTKRLLSIPLLLYIVMLVSIASYIYAFQVSFFWFVFIRDAEEDLLKKIIMFSQSTITLVSVSKLLLMYWNENELRRIIDAYLICDSKVVPFSRMSRNINATLKSVKKRAFIFWVTVMVELVLYVVVRPLVLDRTALKDYQIMWGLEPMIETPNFEITVSVITLTTPITFFVPINISVLLIVIAGYSEAYMLALSKELLSLWDDAESEYRGQFSKESDHVVKIDDFVKRRLENIMKAHAQNKQMFQLVEDVFSNWIAFQFMLLSVSLVANLLGGLENTYMTIPFTLMLVSLDCYTGQNLMDASLAFEAAVYRCKWERFNKNNMKSVLVMLQNAQKTMKLSAGGVASLNYTCFLSIVKKIYSVYAALQSRGRGQETTQDIFRCFND